MEEKKKGVLRFFKLSTGRHKREAAPGTPAQAVKGRKGRKKERCPALFNALPGQT